MSNIQVTWFTGTELIANFYYAKYLKLSGKTKRSLLALKSVPGEFETKAGMSIKAIVEQREGLLNILCCAKRVLLSV